MLINNISNLNTGDWVKGKPQNGELIIGFIEKLGTKDGIVKVTVVKSDNKQTIGKIIQLATDSIEKLPVSKAENVEELQFLIDLALLTEDEDWFFELSTKLNSMRQPVFK